ncbi:hypothetical protein DEO72_LG5g944 [Vigna unguiculata]|uniref:Uncharacterized protein n=1 Tax=Vigna unguiculata TaxID=3917 RepID=A0A4D6LW24_VIGUN|nr:hypothetical protein DEO72_LG5g944 [Vigna unguiculata]
MVRTYFHESVVENSWWCLMVGLNSMNILLRSHGGASWLGRNSTTLLVRAHGGASRGPGIRQDNGLRCLKANLVRGRVKPIGNGFVEQ